MRKNLEMIFVLLIGIAVGIAIYGSYQSHNYHMTTEPEKEIEYVYIEKDPVVIHDTEYVYVESKPEVIEKIVYVPLNEDFFLNFTAREEWCVKDIGMREGEGEGVIGQCWVMYSFLCRCEAFGHSIEEEWASEAYTSMNRSGIEPNEDCLKAFELIREGWTPRPLYFRAGHYHSFGTPLCQVGNHYFSY